MDGGGVGGLNDGGIGDLNGGGMGGMDGDGGTGTESTDGDHPDPGTSALQSMGYIDSGAGMDRTGGDSTGSWTSSLQSVIITAMMVFVGLGFVYFLIGGILAMFGVQL